MILLFCLLGVLDGGFSGPADCSDELCYWLQAVWIEPHFRTASHSRLDIANLSILEQNWAQRGTVLRYFSSWCVHGGFRNGEPVTRKGTGFFCCLNNKTVTPGNALISWMGVCLYGVVSIGFLLRSQCFDTRIMIRCLQKSLYTCRCGKDGEVDDVCLTK